MIVMLGQNTGLAVVTVAMGLVFTVVNSRFVKPVRQISDQVQNELGKLTTRLKDILAGVRQPDVWPRNKAESRLCSRKP